MCKYTFTAYPDPARPDDLGSVFLAVGNDGGAAFKCYTISVREIGDLSFSVSPGGENPAFQPLTDTAAAFVQALQIVQGKK